MAGLNDTVADAHSLLAQINDKYRTARAVMHWIIFSIAYSLGENCMTQLDETITIIIFFVFIYVNLNSPFQPCFLLFGFYKMKSKLRNRIIRGQPKHSRRITSRGRNKKICVFIILSLIEIKFPFYDCVEQFSL